MHILAIIAFISESNCIRGGIHIADKCLPVYSPQSEDKEPYSSPGWTPITNLSTLEEEFNRICPRSWRYESAERLDSLPFRGVFFSYGGGGFSADLGYNLLTAHGVIQGLEDNNWIDERTVALFIEFTVFEPSSSLFSAVKYLVEQGPTGGLYKTCRVDTLVLYYPQDAVARALYQVFQLLFILVICCFFVFELYELYLKRLGYFREFWNWLELTLIISASSAMVLFLFKARYTSKFVRKIHENPFQTSSTDYIVWWAYLELILLSFVVFIVTLKFLQLLKFNNHICHLVETLRSSTKELLSFFVVFMAVLMAYVQLGTLLFGSSTRQYSSVSRTLRLLVERLLGKNMYANEFQTQEYALLGPLFVFTYSVTIAFILLNMFLGILNSSYLDVRREHKRQFSAAELAGFAREHFTRRMRDYRRHLMDMVKNWRTGRPRASKDVRGRYFQESQKLLEENPDHCDGTVAIATLANIDDMESAEDSLQDVKHSLKRIASDLSSMGTASSLGRFSFEDPEETSANEGENFCEGSMQLSLFGLEIGDDHRFRSGSIISGRASSRSTVSDLGS